MSMHESELTMRIGRLLQRKEPRAKIRDNVQALKDETAALVGALRRNCPAKGDALVDWWERFEAAIGEACGDFWPNEKHVIAACKVASQSMPKTRDTTGGWVLDPEAIAARKMNAGEPIGENWLWGQDACRIISKGMVDKATMDAYRSGAFLARKSVNGEAAALAWEAQAKARHDDAKRWFRDSERSMRDVTPPDKRANFDMPKFGAPEVIEEERPSASHWSDGLPDDHPDMIALRSARANAAKSSI